MIRSMQAVVDTKVMNKKINRFITIVAEKYDLDSMELMAIWINSADHVIESPVNAKKAKVEAKVESKVEESSLSSISEHVFEHVSEHVSMKVDDALPSVFANVKCADAVDGKKRKSKKECAYVLLRGPKKGTMCGCTVKNHDNDFCPKHNGGGDDDDEEKKVKKENTTDETPAVATTSTLLRKNKSIDKLWHESTGLVFESSTNRVVIGKCEGDEVKPLSQDDIAVCKQNGFKFLEKEVLATKVPASGSFADDWAVSNPDNNELKRVRKEDVVQKKAEPDVYNDVITDVEQILHGLAQPTMKKEVKKDDDKVGMSYDLSDDEEEFLLEEE
jgi:hypothetical protein